MRLKQTIDTMIYRLEIYEVNNYEVKIYWVDNEQTIEIQPIKDVAFQPEITFFNGEGMLQFHNLCIKPENIDVFIKNVNLAVDTIKKIKEHVKNRKG